jgi:HAD superfamily hydrolase (TIGR01509 family)
MNLIFDFGGVVFRWRPAVLLARVLPALAPTPEAAQRLADDFFQGWGGDWWQFDLGLVEPAELAQRIGRRLGLPATDVAQVIDAVPAELQPIESTVALLARLQAAGHRLSYLSNMPAPLAAHLQREHDFLNVFEQGVYSSEVQLGKPDPAIFHLTLGRLQLQPGEALFIDDHPANIAAARAIGMTALLYTDTNSLLAELARLGITIAAANERMPGV